MFVLDDKKELRITIAKDVLKHLASSRIIAGTGKWMQGFEFKEKSQQICEVIPEKNCQACALGSMFIAAVDRYNECKINEVVPSVHIKLFLDMSGNETYTGSVYFNDNNEGVTGFSTGFSTYMEKYFEKSQLQLIEIAFEFDYDGDAVEYYDEYHLKNGDFGWCGSTGYGDLNNQAERVAAYEFGMSFEPQARLEAIMKNIIKNDGEFCP